MNLQSTLALRRIEYQYRIGYLARLPLRTPYPAIVAAIGSVVRRLPRGTTLLIDNTGVGRAAFDLLRDDGLSPLGIAITAGHDVHHDGNRVSVPKATLVAKLIALTQSGFLRVHGELKEWPMLRRVLQNFRPERTPAGNETWNAATGHDDLIIATALCSWWLQSGGANGHGIFQYYAALANDGVTPETFCVGVDLGQSMDFTAICVISKLPAVPDPERDEHFVKVEENRTEDRVRRDQIADSVTPGHPDAGKDSEVVHLNGPLCRPTYAPGSVEWAEQLRRQQNGV